MSVRADIAIRPSSQDRPYANMGGTGKNIPVLYLDNQYGDVRLQFRTDRPEETAAYLDRLIQAATYLRELVLQQAAVDAMSATPK